MSEKYMGYLLAIAAVFLWSFNIIYSKILTGYLTPTQISFIRWALAALFFIPFTAKSIYKHRRLLWRNIETILIMGLTGLGLLNAFVYHAGHTANAIDMSLIATLGPVFLIILAHFTAGEIITFRMLCGIFLALIGVILLILHGDFENLRRFKLVAGDLWMLGAASMFAIYSLVQKRIPRLLPSFTVLAAAIIVSALLFLPMFVVQLYTHPISHLPAKVIVILLILGFLNSGIAYLIWNIAIKRIGLVRTGMIYYLMPVFSCVSSYFILNETVGISQIYGALFVLGGILLVLKKKNVSRPQLRHRIITLPRRKKQLH